MSTMYGISSLRSAPWLRIAYGELRHGVHRYGKVEAHGRHIHPPGAVHDNPRVLQYLEAARIGAHSPMHNEDTSWCSAFVNWCMIRSGIVGTRSAWARSWLTWKGGVKIGQPIPGAVVVFPRGKNPLQGHVAFVWDVYSPRHFLILGGNQGERSPDAHKHTPGVSSGVTITKDKVVPLGFIWPKKMPMPLAAQMAATTVAPRIERPASFR